jgi:hypothetical protein
MAEVESLSPDENILEHLGMSFTTLLEAKEQFQNILLISIDQELRLLSLRVKMTCVGEKPRHLSYSSVFLLD